jgi:dethiobiotin synthetase
VSALFITGVGTGVGKTLAACALISAARARGLAVGAFKPVLSGFDPAGPQSSDAGRLLAALGRPLKPQSLDDIAPLRFEAPLSPPDAARREGRSLSLADLETRCRARIAATNGLMLIEGAGGVMSPIAEDGLNLDLIAALNLPPILCAANYLGAISHVLTALSALRTRNADVLAVVVQSLDPGGPDIADTLAALHRHAPGVPILAGEGWEDAVLAMATGTRPGRA